MMDSQSDNFTFQQRTRNINNLKDPLSVKRLSAVIKEEYGEKYLNDFINNHPYRNEQTEETQTVREPPKHFSAFAPKIDKSRSDLKKDVNSTIFGIYSDSNLPDLDAECAFRVVYGVHKPSKKHKQWTDDGFILIEQRHVTIYDEYGKTICSRRPVPFGRYVEGEQFVIGSREYEISTRLNVSDIRYGNFSDPQEYQG